MAQLALGIAGAAVGSLFGPIGTSIGFAIGSTAGAYLFAPDQQGPRLSDLSVAVSSYGQPIAQTYGGVRVPCPVIWAAPLQESSDTQSAKGGPEVTTYSYSASFAVVVGEGEIAGIRRIWLDTKCVYDVREGADASTQQKAARFAEFFTFYTGSETQDPDPTIESFEGAGEVEAYRGTAYIVFDSLPLEKHGNRIPMVRVETTTEPEETVPLESLAPYAVNRWALDGEGIPYHFAGPAVYDDLRLLPVDTSDPDDAEAGSFDDFASALAAAQAAFGAQWNVVLGFTNSMNTLLDAFSGGAQITDDAEYFYVWIGRDQPLHVIDEHIDNINPWPVGFGSHGILPEVPADYGLALSAAIMRNAWEPGASARGVMRLVYSTAVESPPTGYEAITQTSLYGPYYPNTSPGPPPAGYHPTVVGTDVLKIRVKRTPFIPVQACEVGDPVLLGIAQLPSNAGICMSATGEMSPNFQFVETPGTYKQLTEVTYGPGGNLTKNGLGPVLRNTDPNYNVQAYWEAAAADAGLSGTYGVDWPVVVTDAGVGEAEATQVEAGSILLSEIVEHICVAAGLDSSQIDVTELDDVVKGYTRTRVMSARAAIEPLRAAYWFDAVDSGAKIRFVKRGAASAATIEADDLGAGIEQAAEQLMEHQRGQQTELPAATLVKYESADADFEVGTQQSRRRVGDSQQVMQVELPIVMTDQKAADIAEVLLYENWVNRNRRTFSTTMKWAHLEPTDVVTVNDGSRSYRLRILEKTDAGGVLNFVAVDDDASTYSPNATAGEVSGGAVEASLTPPMTLQLLDIPIVREADDATSLGYYLAGGGFASGWPGGAAYRSADDGATYSLIQEVRKVATMGYTETVLASWGGGNIVDECSNVEVTLHAGSLSSITRDQLLQGGNPCVIGGEVLQFQRAELVSAGRYRLTGLLRARCGTEDQMEHSLAERFVLLDPGTIYRPGGSLGEIGVETVWAGVTFGAALADAYTRDFTHTGRGAKPLAPINLAAGYTGTAGSYAVTWDRRSRIPHPWMDGMDAPLGEASERYLVEVLDGDAVDSSQTVTSPSATVSAASGNTVRVRQISDLIGPGMPATTTIE